MKNNSKRLIAFAIVLLIVFASCLQNAVASDNSSTVMPLYVGVISTSVSTNVSSSGYATSSCFVSLLPGYTADVTTQLKYDSGIVSGTWSDVGSGLISMNNGKYVTSGHTYYTSLHVVVYDSIGTIVCDINVDSNKVNY